eukprot:5695885-Pleurochrysis_carterae.AAC.3
MRGGEGEGAGEGGRRRRGRRGRWRETERARGRESADLPAFLGGACPLVTECREGLGGVDDGNLHERAPADAQKPTRVSPSANAHPCTACASACFRFCVAERAWLWKSHRRCGERGVCAHRAQTPRSPYYRIYNTDNTCLLYTSDAADDTPCVDL